MYFVGLSISNAKKGCGRFHPRRIQFVFMVWLGLVLAACSQSPAPTTEQAPSIPPAPVETSSSPSETEPVTLNPPASGENSPKPAPKPAEKIWILKKSDPRPKWLQVTPEDPEGEFHYFIGQSVRHSEQQDAVKDALSDAIVQIVGFAAGTQAKIFFESINRTQSVEGNTEDYTENVEKVIQTSEASLDKIKKREQYTETYSQEQGGVSLDTAYKVALLVSFPESEVQNVKAWIAEQIRQRQKTTSNYIELAYDDALKGHVLNAFEWLQKARLITESLPPQEKAGALRVQIERGDLSIAGQVELQFNNQSGLEEIKLSEAPKTLIKARVFYKTEQAEIPVTSGFPVEVKINQEPILQETRSKADGSVIFSLGTIEKEGPVNLTIAPDASLKERLSEDSYQTLSDKRDQLTFQVSIGQAHKIRLQIENARQKAAQGQVVSALALLNDLPPLTKKVPDEADELLFQIKQAEREIAEKVEVLFLSESGFSKHSQVRNKRIEGQVFYQNSGGKILLSGFPLVMALDGQPVGSEEESRGGVVTFFLKNLEKGQVRLTLAPADSLAARISPHAYQALRAQKDQLQFEVVEPSTPSAVYRGNFDAFERIWSQNNEGYEVRDDPGEGFPFSQIEVFEVWTGDCSNVTLASGWNQCEADQESSVIVEKTADNYLGSTYWYGWSIYFPNNYQ